MSVQPSYLTSTKNTYIHTHVHIHTDALPDMFYEDSVVRALTSSSQCDPAAISVFSPNF